MNMSVAGAIVIVTDRISSDNILEALRMTSINIKFLSLTHPHLYMNTKNILPRMWLFLAYFSIDKLLSVLTWSTSVLILTCDRFQMKSLIRKHSFSNKISFLMLVLFLSHLIAWHQFTYIVPNIASYVSLSCAVNIITVCFHNSTQLINMWLRIARIITMAS